MARKIRSILGFIFTAIVCGLLVTALISSITRSYVSLFGYSLFRITTGSMEPDLMIGEVILVKETEPGELITGMDITYISHAASTNGMIITHRIVEDPIQLDDGRYMIVTRGIIDGATDDPAIYDDQIIGKVIYKVNALTYIYSLFSTKAGLLVILVPMMIIIGYEVRTIVKTLRNKDSTGKEGQDEE